MDTPEQSALAEALERMWMQFLPQMRERLALVREGVAAYAAGALTAAVQGSAADAAHKLAGVLGTFGLAGGTVLAREIEVALSCLSGPDPELAEQLTQMAAELEHLIEHRK